MNGVWGETSGLSPIAGISSRGLPLTGASSRGLAFIGASSRGPVPDADPGHMSGVGRPNETTRHADNTNVAGDAKKLKEVCKDFESIFLQYLIREMRASIPKSGLLGGGFSEEVFMSLFDENLAREMARRGGIGIGDMLLKQLYRERGMPGEGNQRYSETGNSELSGSGPAGEAGE